MSEDWLETKPPPPIPGKYKSVGQRMVVEALFDDVTPAQTKDQVPATVWRMDPTYREWVLALRALKPQQRTYLRVYMQTGRRVEAIKAVNEKHRLKIGAPTVSRWHRVPAFCKGMEVARKLALQLADLDPTSLQLIAGKVIERGMEPEPIYSRDGDIVGYDRGDLNVVMRATEWLGKVHRMTEAESQRVTLEVINLTGREDPPENAIDLPPADFTDVTPE